jgi:hypothetical protein
LPDYFGENDFYKLGINFEKGHLEYFFLTEIFFEKEKPSADDSSCIIIHIDNKNIIIHEECWRNRHICLCYDQLFRKVKPIPVMSNSVTKIPLTLFNSSNITILRCSGCIAK